MGFDSERPDATQCPLPFRMLLEACWRHDAYTRPTFAQLSTLDLVGLGRGSATAVRQMRQLLWPDGTPAEWCVDEQGDDAKSLPSTDSFESYGAAGTALHEAAIVNTGTSTTSL